MRRYARAAALAGLTGLAALAAAPAFARDDIRTERVRFDPGADSAVIEGSIAGYESVDYLLGARAGQRMTVEMTTDHTASYFNVLPPGAEYEAIFIGSTEGHAFDDVLAESGDYTVRVYMMRSAARRGEVAGYRLTLSDAVGRAGVPAEAAADFDETGLLACADAEDRPMRQCPYGVARGGGTAAVAVTLPDGRTRTLFFSGGEAETGGDGAFSAVREGDVTLVRIGGERYEIPDAVVRVEGDIACGCRKRGGL